MGLRGLGLVDFAGVGVSGARERGQDFLDSWVAVG